MIQKTVRFLLFVYQGIFQRGNAACRFMPTCSQYAAQAIEKYGVLKGSWFVAKRLSSCHPFSKRPIYDPA